MNMFGVGNLEIVFVLIVALLVLGPSRMVDGARQIGTWWREAQKILRGIADAATVSVDAPSEGDHDLPDATTETLDSVPRKVAPNQGPSAGASSGDADATSRDDNDV